MAASHTIAITGASGFLGGTLVEHFASIGWHVIGLVRNPQAQPVRKGVTYRQYDVLQPLQNGSLKGVDCLVHAAYIKTTPTQMTTDPNIIGAEQLLKAVSASNVRKTVFISSMSSHEGAISAYGKQKFAIEGLVSSNGGVSLRPGLILGKGGIVASMSQFIKRFHVVPLVAGGTQPIQVVRAEEIATAVERVITLDEHGVLTIASPSIYTYKSFYSALARRLRIRVFFIPVPYSILLMATTLLRLVPGKLGVDVDSVRGLKKLISVNVEPDLQKLNLSIDDLETSLAKLSI
jgi:nucleoside-diphosphate-sugar epimerase